MNKTQMAGLAVMTALLVLLLGLVINNAMEPDMRSFPLRYLSGREAADIVSEHVPATAEVVADDKTLFVRASTNKLAEVALILEREDRPKPQVGLHFRLIEADGFTATDTSIAAIESVLRSLFRFQGYRLVAESYVQQKEGSSSQQVMSSSDGQRYYLAVEMQEVLRRDGKSSAMIDARLSNDAGQVLSTSVHVPDGQTVVLGTSRPDAQKGALILVVVPTIR